MPIVVNAPPFGNNVPDAMADLDDFLPQISKYARTCPSPVIHDHVIAASQEFCKRTRMWRSGLTPIASSGIVQPSIPSGAVLFELQRIRVKKQDIRIVNTTWLDEHWPDWRNAEPSENPSYCTQTDMNTFRLIGPYTGLVETDCILMPADDARAVPDFLARNHRRCIADGALSEILMIPGYPFSNPELALMFRGRFMQELDSLSNFEIRGQQRSPGRVRSSFF